MPVMIDRWASSHGVDRVGAGALSASAVSGAHRRSRLMLTDSRAAERSGSVRPAGRLPFDAGAPNSGPVTIGGAGTAALAGDWRAHECRTCWAFVAAEHVFDTGLGRAPTPPCAPVTTTDTCGTHGRNMENALAMGRRIVVMSRGRIVGDVGGDAKRDLRPTDLIDLITGAGDAVSDRLLLPEFEQVGVG